MIPLADDLPRSRPARVTLLTWLAADVAALISLLRGDGLATTALLLVCGLWIWIFGRSVEDRIGPLWLSALVLFGGAGAVLLGIASGMESRYAAAAATGVAFEIVIAHRARFRRARVLCLSPVPYYAGLLMTPAWVWALAGGVLAALLAFAGAYGG